MSTRDVSDLCHYHWQVECEYVEAYHEPDPSKKALTLRDQMKARVEHDPETSDCSNPEKQRNNEIYCPITARYKVDENSEDLTEGYIPRSDE
jgi:hypothetical protein